MILLYSKKVINNISVHSSLIKKNKKSIFLYKKQKSHRSMTHHKKKYFKAKKPLEFDFSSFKNKILSNNREYQVSREGFKKLISSFLIKSGKSKKLENKVYNSYLFFSKKYPDYWLDKHIELFFTRYAFPLIYTEKYRIFRKRRSKKPHFARQSLNTLSEQKYIFNFFKEFLSKKLTRNFEKTFQYHFLTLTSSKLGLSSVQKSRTKEYILKWNRFSKAARLHRKNKHKNFSKKNFSIQKKFDFFSKNKNRTYIKDLKISQKFLNRRMNSLIKSSPVLKSKKEIFSLYKSQENPQKSRQLYWLLARKLKTLEKDLFWKIKHSGITYKFLFSTNFFDSYKDYLGSLIPLKKTLLDKSFKFTKDFHTIYKDRKRFLGENLSSLRIGKKHFFHLEFKPSYTSILKNNKEWLPKRNLKFSSKYNKKRKKSFYYNLQKLFTILNKLYVKLKYIDYHSRRNINSNINSLNFTDLMLIKKVTKKNRLNKSKYKFMKKIDEKPNLEELNEKKFLNYKNFYIKQKVINSFKSNRYSNILQESNFYSIRKSVSIEKQFKLENFLRKSNTNLILSFRRALKKKKTFPFFREKEKIAVGVQHEKLFCSKGRKEKILFNKRIKVRKSEDLKLKKYEKTFKYFQKNSRFLFKPKYSLILNNLNTFSSKTFYETGPKNSSKFPLMFNKINKKMIILINIESSSKKNLLKIMQSFKNLVQRNFSNKDYKVSYHLEKEQTKRLSVLTSPHVNKIAQQHFEKVSNKGLIKIEFHNKKNLEFDCLLKWVKILNKSTFMSKVNLKVKHS